MIIYHALCFEVAFFTLQYYIVKKKTSLLHRLLPVLLELIALYNVVQILFEIDGKSQLSECMEYLILVQIVYALMWYVFDFMRIQIVRGFAVSLLLMHVAVTLCVVYMYAMKSEYKSVLLVYAIFILLVIGWASIWGGTHLQYTGRERKNDLLIYASLVVPALAIQMKMIHPHVDNGLLSSSFLVFCIAMHYLLFKERLNDLNSSLIESVYDSADLPTLLFDENFEFMDANKEAIELFHLSWKRYARQGREKAIIERKTRPVLNLPGVAFEFDWDGRNMKARASVLENEHKCIGYMITFVDISREKEEMRIMEQLKNGAEEAAKNKSRFLATMSHDLRSPIHAILGMSDIILMDKKLAYKHKSLAMNIKNSGNLLLEHVNAILNYSKLEAGKIVLARTTYDLEKLILEVMNLNLVNMERKNIAFSTEFVTTYPKMIIGDRSKVRDCMQNILSNAMKFTKEGSIRCKVEAKMDAVTESVCITYTVEDTGCGMNEEQLAGLFTDYVSYSENQMQEGTGLGMSIVKQFAELMGGKASASSAVNEGTTVSFAFYHKYKPEVIQEPKRLDAKNLKKKIYFEEKAITPNYVYPKARVLQVDDVAVNREVFRSLVQPWQFEIVEAENGEDALAKIANENFDLIFLDLMMPQMSGEEVLEKAKHFTKTKFVALTADLSDGVKENCLEKGFADFIEKPMDMGELKNVIESLLPKEKAIPVGAVQSGNLFQEGNQVQDNAQLEALLRTLQTYVKEMQTMQAELATIYEENLELFAIKVHGIKSVNRQLGREGVSEKAEILEMAAKTQNRKFIERNLDDFQEELKASITTSIREIKLYEEWQQEDTEKLEEELQMQDKKTEPRDKKQLWNAVREGFANYNIDQIERNMKVLRKCDLTQEELGLLEQLAEFAEDFDYEAGLLLFQKEI